MPEQVCPICRGALWVCESEPSRPWIPGSTDVGIRCECNPRELMPPDVEICAEIQPAPKPKRQ